MLCNVSVVYLFTIPRISAYNLTLNLECGPMPNVMVALLNVGGTFCSMPQSLADAHY